MSGDFPGQCVRSVSPVGDLVWPGCAAGRFCRMDGGLYETAVGGKEFGSEYLLYVAVVKEGTWKEALRCGISKGRREVKEGMGM